MSTVGAFEAKTHLSRLLDQVERGEEIIITRHGEPVAKLVSARDRPDADQTRKLIVEIKQLRKGMKLGALSIKELIQDGRKY